MEVPGRRLVAQEARAEDADGFDARVPDLGHGLDAAAAVAGGHDLGAVDAGVLALAGVLDDPVDRRRHQGGRRRLRAPRRPRRDGQVAVRGHLRQEVGVGRAVAAAAAVAPDEHGELGRPHRARRHVDGVLG